MANRIKRDRVLLGFLAIKVAGAAIVLLACALPTNPAGWLGAFVLGVVLVPLLASPLEWVVHRNIYHHARLPILRKIQRIHHHGHHQVYFPTWRYTAHGPTRRFALTEDKAFNVHASGWTNFLTGSLHFVAYFSIGMAMIALPAWLLTANLAFVAGITLSSGIISALFIIVHDAIHHPGSMPWIERTKSFAFLDEHHYIHHVDTDANVNFLLPLCDLIFGTLRLSLTAEEAAKHGSRAEAKQNIVGFDEPAHLALQREQTKPSAHTKKVGATHD